MGFRAVLFSFLLSSAAAIAAIAIWGLDALIPFTIGEITGALAALLIVGSSLSLLYRTKRSSLHGKRRNRPQRAMSKGRDTAAARISQCPRYPMNAQVHPLIGFVGTARRVGQVSPYFPGVRAWSYSSCPPLRRSLPARGRRALTADVETVIVDIEDYQRAAACVGLLASHFPPDRNGS